jgi:DNA-binding MarR family transcriptional regulator
MAAHKQRSPGGTGAGAHADVDLAREADHHEDSLRAAPEQAPSTTGKAVFAPLPARAIGDQRLSGLHFRVLGAIAMHDRISGKRKGQGCWAGNQTLAAECGCNYSNLSTAITELGRWGYVEREMHPLNKRLRIHRVVYTGDDLAFTKLANTLPRGKQSAQIQEPTVCPETEKSRQTVCPIEKITPLDQRDSGVEYITRSVEYTQAKPLNKFRETARINTSAFLARSQRALRRREFSQAELHDLRDVLEEITSSEPVGTTDYQWAERLMDECSSFLEEDIPFGR